ncbi:STAS domain-containing protein [Herbidospora sp. RD11066]
MEITSYRRGTVTVLAVSGDLDTMTAGALRERIAGVDGSGLVLDLSEVTFIDSAGIRLLFAAFVAKSVGPGRKAIAGLGGQVERVLTVMGMTGRLPCHRNVDAALTGLFDTALPRKLG